jgi:hypothetical protein
MKNKKSAGLDDISTYSLKKCIPHIIKLLLELVNISIREGIFPSKLKKIRGQTNLQKREKRRCN